MASRFNNIIGANQYQPLPLDSLMKIGLARDEETQSLYDKYNSKLSSVGMIPTSNAWDENKVKSIVDDRNKTLSDIAKYDITTPEGEQKVRGLINELSTNQDLIKAANNTAAHKQAVEWLQKNSENTYNPNLYAPGSYFDNYEKYDQSGKGDISNFMPPMEYQDESKFGLDVVKTLDPSTIQGLQYDPKTDVWSSSTGKSPESIASAILGSASPKLLQQWKNEYTYYSGSSPTSSEFKDYILNKAKSWGEGYQNEVFKYDYPNNTNRSSSNTTGKLPTLPFEKQIGEINIVNPKESLIDKLGNAVLSMDEHGYARETTPNTQYSDLNIPEYNNYTKPQTTLIDKFVTTASPQVKDAYSKYQKNEKLTKSEQQLVSGILDQAKSYVSNYGEYKSSYTTLQLDKSDPYYNIDPKKILWSSYNYYDPNTNEVINGKDLTSKYDVDVTGADSVIAGKVYGAAEFNNNNKGEQGFGNGYIVKLASKDGKSYTELIMQNPNGETHDDKLETIKNNARVWKNLPNDLGNGKSLIYNPVNDGGYYSIVDEKGKPFDIKLPKGSINSGKISDEEVKYAIDALNSQPTETPKTQPSPQFKQPTSGNPNAIKTYQDISSEFKDVSNLGIWGDTAHQQTNSDHNTGDALDIGIKDSSEGDKIAQKLISEAKERNIKYIIWNGYIWNPSISNEWRPYSGKSNHSDHIHISYSS